MAGIYKRRSLRSTVVYIKLCFPILTILLTSSYLIQVGAFAQHSPESYPTFLPLPGKAGVWELGKKPNWPELRRRLAPFTDGGFYVNDEKSEKHLASIRKRLDMYPSSPKWTLLHQLIGDRGGDDEQLIHQLLSMGVDPDLPKLGISWRPSHLTGGYARVAAAKALVLCRVNQSSLNPNKDTPIAAASQTYNEENIASLGLNETELREIRPLVHEIWLRAEEKPPPSVAEMASHEQWYAVQNLCRRRAISGREASEKFNGKTAYEWAVHHREYGIAVELQYLLQQSQNTSGTQTSGTITADSSPAETGTVRQSQITGSETANLRRAIGEEIKNHFDSSLEAHNEQLWNKFQKLIQEKFEVNATCVQPTNGGKHYEPILIMDMNGTMNQTEQDFLKGDN